MNRHRARQDGTVTAAPRHADYARRAPRLRIFFAALAMVLSCADADRSAPSADVGPCREGDPDRERHGTSCLCCHAKTFGVAGSVQRDAGVATIRVRDRDGRTAEMTPNPHDNFFRHLRLSPPLEASLVFEDGTTVSMRAAAPHGSCNGCHGVTTPMLGTR